MGSGGWGRQEAQRSADAFRAARRSERARGGREADPRARGSPGADVDRSTFPPRHCWVTDPPAAPGRWPGVVVGWRPVDAGWEGRVVVVVGSGPGAGVLDVWVGEAQLTPA